MDTLESALSLLSETNAGLDTRVRSAGAIAEILFGFSSSGSSKQESVCAFIIKFRIGQRKRKETYQWEIEGSAGQG